MTVRVLVVEDEARLADVADEQPLGGSVIRIHLPVVGFSEN